MGALFQIVYASVAKDSLGQKELVDLLKGSVARNAKAGVTGLLLYKDGRFMQVLEGRESVVVPLFSKISRDPRHHHVVPLMHGRIQERHFPNSAMAFRNLDSAEVRDLPGYSDFLNTPLNGDLLKENLAECERLLLLFKEDAG